MAEVVDLGQIGELVEICQIVDVLAARDPEAVARRLIADVLEADATVAPVGFPCRCIFHSRYSDDYHKGRCPHQRARNFMLQETPADG